MILIYYYYSWLFLLCLSWLSSYNSRIVYTLSKAVYVCTFLYFFLSNDYIFNGLLSKPSGVPLAAEAAETTAAVAYCMWLSPKSFCYCCYFYALDAVKNLFELLLFLSYFYSLYLCLSISFWGIGLSELLLIAKSDDKFTCDRMTGLVEILLLEGSLVLLLSW